MNILIDENKTAHVWRDLGNGFQGWTPADTYAGEPTMHWRGGKIKLEDWRAMLAFFQHSYTATMSETQVRLFYNAATQQWRIGAMPQEHGTGMTARDLPEHESYAATLASYMAGGFIGMGTGHHHCSAGAFQSGTDNKDEKQQMGLHITIGNVDKPRLSLHARVSMVIPGSIDGDTIIAARQVFYPAQMLEWVECPELPAWLPEELREKALLHLLTTPVEEPKNLCPDGWMGRLIKSAAPVKRQPPAAGFGSAQLQDWWRRAEDVYTPAVAQHQAFADEVEAEAEANAYLLAEEVFDYCMERNVSLKTARAILMKDYSALSGADLVFAEGVSELFWQWRIDESRDSIAQILDLAETVGGGVQ